MKVLILTSSLFGTASHHLRYLIDCKAVTELQVVLSKNEVKNKGKFYKRKFKKLLKIGPLGMLNGIKMRQWFGEDVRSHTSIPSLVELCSQHDIKLTIVSSLNSPQCVDAFTVFAPDIAISLGNGYIPSKIFMIPTKGMLNIHHEMLPEFQNAQSVIWQLYKGSKNSGYTIHMIDKGIDTGRIVHQAKVPIDFRQELSETVSSTVARLYDSSAEGLCEVLSHLDQKLVNATPQGKGGHFTTPSWSQMRRIKQNHARLMNEV